MLIDYTIQCSSLAQKRALKAEFGCALKQSKRDPLRCFVKLEAMGAQELRAQKIQIEPTAH